MVWFFLFAQILTQASFNPLQPCGKEGEQCCCNDFDSCWTNGMTQTHEYECENAGGPPEMVCSSNVCTSCGGVGQPCCDHDNCNENSLCSNGMCEECGTENGVCCSTRTYQTISAGTETPGVTTGTICGSKDSSYGYWVFSGTYCSSWGGDNPITRDECIAECQTAAPNFYFANWYPAYGCRKGDEPVGRCQCVTEDIDCWSSENHVSDWSGHILQPKDASQCQVGECSSLTNTCNNCNTIGNPCCSQGDLNNVIQCAGGDGECVDFGFGVTGNSCSAGSGRIGARRVYCYVIYDQQCVSEKGVVQGAQCAENACYRSYDGDCSRWHTSAKKTRNPASTGHSDPNYYYAVPYESVGVITDERGIQYVKCCDPSRVESKHTHYASTPFSCADGLTCVNYEYDPNTSDETRPNGGNEYVNRCETIVDSCGLEPGSPCCSIADPEEGNFPWNRDWHFLSVQYCQHPMLYCDTGSMQCACADGSDDCHIRTMNPTEMPTTTVPSTAPSTSPTVDPSSSIPSISPSASPSHDPSAMPTFGPTPTNPTVYPTKMPTTTVPSTGPSMSPTVDPSSSMPTSYPSFSDPTNFPSTSKPSKSPLSAKSNYGHTAYVTLYFEGMYWNLWFESAHHIQSAVAFALSVAEGAVKLRWGSNEYPSNSQRRHLQYTENDEVYVEIGTDEPDSLTNMMDDRTTFKNNINQRLVNSGSPISSVNGIGEVQVSVSLSSSSDGSDDSNLALIVGLAVGIPGGLLVCMCIICCFCIYISTPKKSKKQKANRERYEHHNRFEGTDSLDSKWKAEVGLTTMAQQPNASGTYTPASDPPSYHEVNP